MIDKLRQAGVSDNEIAVLVSSEAEEVGNVLTDTGAEGAIAGASVGGVGGAAAGLVGLALLPIPGLNAVGAASLMAGAIGGIGGGFLGALFGSRIEENVGINLKDELAQGGFLVIAGVNKQNEQRIAGILRGHGGKHVSIQEVSSKELQAVQEHHERGENAVPSPDGTREHYDPTRDN